MAAGQHGHEVASALVRQTGFAYVRVDRIEQAMVASAALRPPLGPVGYMVAYEVAAEQLRHGVSVVAECENPLGVTRDAWRAVAAGDGARLLEVELICTDQAAHRERVRSRRCRIMFQPIKTDYRGCRAPGSGQSAPPPSPSLLSPVPHEPPAPARHLNPSPRPRQ